MQNLDVTITEAAWSSLAGKIYVPHSEEEYRQLVVLLDSFIDEVGEDESHPLASLMEIVGVLVEKYEDDNVSELSGVLSDDATSITYAQAAERARRFFVSVSTEADTLNARINAYAHRMERITKQGSPAEFEAIIIGSATDLEVFAQRMEALLPDYKRDVELTAEGFDHALKSLDPSTSAGMGELQGMRREARKLTETAAEVKTKVATLRSAFEVLRDANHDPRLTNVAQRLVALADELINAYEDLETLALRVSFSSNQ
jgi:HTH-type transcriptional regulator / antitoxin HigA